MQTVVENGVYVSDSWGRVIGYRNSLVDKIRSVQEGQFMNKARKDSKPRVVTVSKKKPQPGAIARVTI